MAKKKRVTRKQLLKEPDEFLTFSARAIQFAANNRKPVLGAVIGLFIALVAIVGFRYYAQTSERKAFALLEEARFSYLAQTFGVEKAPAPEEAVKKLEEVIEDYPSTTAARFSLLVYGDLSYETGNYDKAIELYEKASEAFSQDGAIQKMIWNGMGHAYEAKQDYGHAAEYYRRMAEVPDRFLEVDAYYNLGRMLEAMGDQEGALEAYKKVLETENVSTGFPIAEEKVSRLQAALGLSE